MKKLVVLLLGVFALIIVLGACQAVAPVTQQAAPAAVTAERPQHLWHGSQNEDYLRDP